MSTTSSSSTRPPERLPTDNERMDYLEQHPHYDIMWKAKTCYLYDGPAADEKSRVIAIGPSLREALNRAITRPYNPYHRGQDNPHA